ncbi:MAG TPA: MFS transporter [Roseiflexaceae bacterium]
MLATLRQHNFALLWFGGLISLTGDWMLFIALPIYVYTLTGSTLATSAMFVAEMIPNLLLGSVAGVFVDRWDRKRTMVIANLLLALGLLPLFAVRSAEWLWLAYLVGFVESAIVQFFKPAESALLPQLVAEEHLVAANSLNALNSNLARLVGPALGGIVAGLLGLPGVVFLDAGSFLITGIMIALIGGVPTRASAAMPRSPGAPATAWVAIWREWLAGLRLVRSERPVLIVFAMLAITALGEGVMGVLFVVFVNKVLGGGALEIGWLMSAQAVGGLIGGVIVGFASKQLSPARLIGLSAIVFGLIDLAIFNYPAFIPGIALGLILFVVVGVPGVGFMSGVNTLLQTAVVDQYRGRVFGALGTTQALLMLIGTLAAGMLGDRLGVVTMLNIQGGGYVLAGCAALILLPGAATWATRIRQQEAQPSKNMNEFVS